LFIEIYENGSQGLQNAITLGVYQKTYAYQTAFSEAEIKTMPVLLV